MPRGRPLDADRDVYSDWAVIVVNATRQALRAQYLMSNDELAIVNEVLAKLLELDPAAEGVRLVGVRTKSAAS